MSSVNKKTEDRVRLISYFLEISCLARRGKDCWVRTEVAAKDQEADSWVFLWLCYLQKHDRCYKIRDFCPLRMIMKGCVKNKQTEGDAKHDAVHGIFWSVLRRGQPLRFKTLPAQGIPWYQFSFVCHVPSAFRVRTCSLEFQPLFYQGVKVIRLVSCAGQTAVDSGVLSLLPFWASSRILP